MKRLALFALLVTLAAPAGYAQEQPSALYVSGAPAPARVSVETIYQRFSEDGAHIAEVSVPLSVYLPLGDRFAMSLRSNYATISGSDLETASGVGDVQLVASLYQPLGAASLVASLGVNATTGRSALSAEEFRTATLAGQTIYDLRVPTFGQGLRVAPALTVAFPAGDRAALGLGLSYQYRGPYEPLRGLADQYDPGEEILLTAGADVQLGAASSASLDVSFGLNGTDTWGVLEYDPGSSLSATAQYRLALGLHEVRAVASYRSRSEGELPEEVVPSEAVVPTRLQLLADARFQVDPSVRVGGLARFRTYDASALFPERQTLVDVGLVPEWSASERVRLVGRFVYTLGSFSGLTAGGGLSVAF